MLPGSPIFPLRFVLVLTVLSGILFFLLVSPVLNLIASSSFSGLLLAASNAEAVSAIALTIYTSALTALAAVLFGLPLGYLLGKYQFPGRSLLDSIIEIPLMIPHTVAGIALITIFGPAEVVGSVFSGSGLG